MQSWRSQYSASGMIFLISLFTLTPLSVIALAIDQVDHGIWSHLAAFLLPELIQNTLVLLIGVGLLSSLIAIPLAWLVAIYDFPARRILTWALMLPLAIPSYVMAFAQLGLFSYTGPIQTLLRDIGYPIPSLSLQSHWGVIWVIGLAFYPYLYLLARQAFLSQGRQAIEVGQSLGFSRWRSLIKVAIPMTRPWLVGGILLVWMETLADFGAVSILNYNTFTTAIYQAWFSFFSLETAKQLALILVLFVLAIAWAEEYSRGQQAYAPHKPYGSRRILLTGWQAWGASLWAGIVLCLAFILPITQLVAWAWAGGPSQAWQWKTAALASLGLSSLATLAVLLVAITLVLAKHRSLSKWWQNWSKVATLGYAIPGSVLAVGFFVPIAFLDHQIATLNNTIGSHFPYLKGTLLTLILAYIARFLAVGFASTDAAIHKITRSQREILTLMGIPRNKQWFVLYWPALKSGILTSGLLVFVDVMKEMPITLMTRPFGWDTLAVKIFTLTSEGYWDEAAVPALMIVACGLIPVIYLAKHSEEKVL